METITKEIARSDRQEEPFTAMMIDLDHFKKYNDTYGHLAGDEILVKMAAIFSDCIREVDYAARYGGEEFLILLPKTDLEGGVEVAERIRNQLSDTKPDDGKKKVGITLSIGIAEFPQHGDTAQTIIAAADAALYQAKRHGRNQVERATTAKRKAARPRGKQARKRA
jgi:diguanylate cyclase (GGDEF)-like protein